MMDIVTQEFIAYKSAGDYVVELKVPVGSRTNRCRKDVVDPDFAMFRTDKAHVLSIRHKDSDLYVDSVFSDYDPMFQYIVGKDVEPREEYDLDPDNVSASGIHFFLTKEAAYDYHRVVIDGIRREWHDNGVLAGIWTRKNGSLHGECIINHSNGVCAASCKFDNGILSGLYREWDELGVLRYVSIRHHTKSIYYKKDNHTMGFTICDICDEEESVEQTFWHENELTLEDKLDHMKQLSNTGKLILSSDYKQVSNH